MSASLTLRRASAPNVWADTIEAQRTRENSAPSLSEEAAALIAEREEARRMKQWNRADALRDQLTEMGYTVTDTPQGTQWEIA